ncbi:hypothetical protein M8494_25280 [Serratia ureilytica]
MASHAAARLVVVAAAAGAAGGVAMNAVARRAWRRCIGLRRLFGALFVVLFCRREPGRRQLHAVVERRDDERRATALAQLLDDAKAYGEDGAAPYVMLPSARYR